MRIWACLKEAWGCTPTPAWNTLPLFNQLKFIVFELGNVAAVNGYDHVSAGLECASEMGRDSEGQSSGYFMTSLQTVPCHIAGMLELSC